MFPAIQLEINKIRKMQKSCVFSIGTVFCRKEFFSTCRYGEMWVGHKKEAQVSPRYIYMNIMYNVNDTHHIYICIQYTYNIYPQMGMIFYTTHVTQEKKE